MQRPVQQRRNGRVVPRNQCEHKTRVPEYDARAAQVLQHARQTQSSHLPHTSAERPDDAAHIEELRGHREQHASVLGTRLDARVLERRGRVLYARAIRLGRDARAACEMHERRALVYAR